MALTQSQRRKRAITFKKSLKKRLRSKERLKRKKAPEEVLLRRAKQKAKKIVIIKKKILPNELIDKYPNKLSVPQKVAVEDKLKEHRKLVKSIAVKILKLLKRQEAEKVLNQSENK